MSDTVAARLELTELVHRYCLYTDGERWDELGGLFTEDIDFAGALGRAEVVAALRRARAGFGRTVHTAHGVVVDFVDDEHATGVVPTHAELAVDGTYIVCAMRYLDTYVRDRGAWRFRKRRVRYTYALPWESMAGALTDELPVRWPGARPRPADGWR